MKQFLKSSVSIIVLCLMTNIAWGMNKSSEKDKGGVLSRRGLRTSSFSKLKEGILSCYLFAT